METSTWSFFLMISPMIRLLPAAADSPPLALEMESNSALTIIIPIHVKINTTPIITKQCFYFTRCGEIVPGRNLGLTRFGWENSKENGASPQG
jgi:hypothetical protein